MYVFGRIALLSNEYISEEEINSPVSCSEPLNLGTPLSTRSVKKRRSTEVKFTEVKFTPDANKTKGL